MSGYLGRLAARGADAGTTPALQPRADPLRAIDAHQITPVAEPIAVLPERPPLGPGGPPSEALPAEPPAPPHPEPRPDITPPDAAPSPLMRRGSDMRSAASTFEVRPAAEPRPRVALMEAMPGAEPQRPAPEAAPSPAGASRHGKGFAAMEPLWRAVAAQPSEPPPVPAHAETSLSSRALVEPRTVVVREEHRAPASYPQTERRGLAEPADGTAGVEVSIGRVVVEVAQAPPSRPAPASPPARAVSDPRMALARSYRDRLRY